MSAPTAIKVFIRNHFGEYLAGSDGDWSFTPERALAHIFDYHADDVARQLSQAHRDHGVHWIAYPVDPNLVGETCDACGQRMHPTDATFDGTRFLCPACRISPQTQ